MLGLPAGVGFATLRSILKLWLGISPKKSGVVSAGNGPAMRSPILGVAFGHDPQKLKQYVKASTEITHSDPKAYYAAFAVALASRDVAGTDLPWQDDYLETLKTLLLEEGAQEFHQLVRMAAVSAANGERVSQFAEAIGSKNGISGYCYHTVPCVFQVWFRFGDDFAGGLRKIIEAGGDTDTAGAILGGIVGGRAGTPVIPEDWLGGIVEWPRTVGWMERLGNAVAEAVGEQPATVKCPHYFVPGTVLRNLIFLLVVLAHGFRRLGPPY